MTEHMERVLMEALQAKRPVLVNPTDDEIHTAAEDLRKQRKLICTACRKVIDEPEFESQRITFSPRLQAVAHLHVDCAENFRSDMAQQNDSSG